MHRLSRAGSLALLIASSLGGCHGADSIAGDSHDLAPAAPDLLWGPGTRPLGGTVTVTGGTVDRLYFGFTGDTRPANADDTAGYPSATINGIFTRLAAADVQFTVDLGDHMYIVNDTADAPAQMAFYTAAAQNLGAIPLFMTLGNHDCGITNCYYSLRDPNYLAYMAALAPVSALPYYTFTVQTHSGPAVFVILSDNFDGGGQAAWLDKIMTAADKGARHTIVARHHPLDYDSASTNATQAIVLKHKYSLFLTGHSHTYIHDPNDPSGRTVIYGLGGVPNSGPDFGYGIVQQGLDDGLYVTIYDQATGMPIDSWSVPPQS